MDPADRSPEELEGDLPAGRSSPQQHRQVFDVHQWGDQDEVQPVAPGGGRDDPGPPLLQPGAAFRHHPPEGIFALRVELLQMPCSCREGQLGPEPADQSLDSRPLCPVGPPP
ncbi:hypothetical protein SDC9_80865 [bioreactor metagenome]|uniref:Uncharacterized protein n=1 Tax=bioreactor metagenome TaxID=1076179 RepID=A0A644Z6D3_9ZZZZ